MQNRIKLLTVTVTVVGLVALNALTVIAQPKQPIVIADKPIEEYTYEDLGTFKATAYCPCKKCCGKTDGITFTGTKAQQGRTIAVDQSVIPLGSTIIINGQAYVAEDIGGAIKGNRIDVFFEEHSDAVQFGVQEVEVGRWIKEW